MLKTGLESQGNNVINFTPGFELWGAAELSSYGSRPCLQKMRARLTGCAIDIWIEASPTGISFQVLVFSFHSLYLTAATGVWKRKRDPKGQRAFPSSVLRSGSTGSVITSPWHEHLDRPPQLSWNLAARSSQAGVWLSVSVQTQPGLTVSRRSKYHIPEEHWAVFWHLLWAG